MMMQDLLASFVGVVLVPFTLALLIALCERLPIGLSATHRSWVVASGVCQDVPCFVHSQLDDDRRSLVVDTAS